MESEESYAVARMAATDYAWRVLLSEEFCPERSRLIRVERLAVRDETDQAFGSELWAFDANAVDDAAGDVQRLYGTLLIGIEYGRPELRDWTLTDLAEERRQTLTRRCTAAVAPTGEIRIQAWPLLLLVSGLLVVAVATLTWMGG